MGVIKIIYENGEPSVLISAEKMVKLENGNFVGYDENDKCICFIDKENDPEFLENLTLE